MNCKKLFPKCPNVVIYIRINKSLKSLSKCNTKHNIIENKLNYCGFLMIQNEMIAIS